LQHYQEKHAVKHQRRSKQIYITILNGSAIPNDFASSDKKKKYPKCKMAAKSGNKISSITTSMDKTQRMSSYISHVLFQKRLFLSSPKPYFP